MKVNESVEKNDPEKSIKLDLKSNSKIEIRNKLKSKTGSQNRNTKSRFSPGQLKAKFERIN